MENDMLTGTYNPYPAYIHDIDPLVPWEQFYISILKGWEGAVVLYGCETWSLTVREERKLRVFENNVLRRIFGPKKDGVTGGWRKLQNIQASDGK
jgi:hypothetical protein